MTSLPEQFQAARQNQLDHQFNLVRTLSDQALERTGRLYALHLDLSRAALEHSSNTVRQLLALRDPRDLLTIGAQSQRQLRTVFDYSQELFNIAAGLRGAALRTYSAEAAAAVPMTAPAPATTPALAAPVLAEAAAVVEETQDALQTNIDAVAEASKSANEQLGAVVGVVVSNPAPPPAPAALAVSTASAPDTDPVVTSTIAPPVAPTAIAQATSEVLDLPLAPPHPVAASVPVEVAVEIELPKVAPVDATPPVAVPGNGGPKVTEIRGGRGRKKGS